MAVERMSCCGELTHTYGDAGRRIHAADCPLGRPLGWVIETYDTSWGGWRTLPTYGEPTVYAKEEADSALRTLKAGNRSYQFRTRVYRPPVS